MDEARVLGPSCPTYFDTLPNDVHVRLLDRLDTVWFENSENEQKPGESVSTRGRRGFLSFLFSEYGPFYNLVSSLSTSITLDTERNSTDVSIIFTDCGISIGPELFEGEELRGGLVERVLKACGESTKEIVVAVDDPRLLNKETGENGFIRQFESLLIQYCPAVERLEFGTAFLKEETYSLYLRHTVRNCVRLSGICRRLAIVSAYQTSRIARKSDSCRYQLRHN